MPNMEKLSLQAKKAYFAKTRKSNYMASLRLEGFTSVLNETAVLNDADQKTPTPKAAVKRAQSIKA